MRVPSTSAVKPSLATLMEIPALQDHVFETDFSKPLPVDASRTATLAAYGLELSDEEDECEKENFQELLDALGPPISECEIAKMLEDLAGNQTSHSIGQHDEVHTKPGRPAVAGRKYLAMVKTGTWRPYGSPNTFATPDHVPVTPPQQQSVSVQKIKTTGKPIMDSTPIGPASVSIAVPSVSSSKPCAVLKRKPRAPALKKSAAPSSQTTPTAYDPRTSAIPIQKNYKRIAEVTLKRPSSEALADFKTKKSKC